MKYFLPLSQLLGGLNQYPELWLLLEALSPLESLKIILVTLGTFLVMRALINA